MTSSVPDSRRPAAKVNVQALKGRKAQVMAFLPQDASGLVYVPISSMEHEAAVEALEREQRWQFAVEACLELYEQDPEYAEEWPALHHLKHVRDGETNPDCEWCAREISTR